MKHYTIAQKRRIAKYYTRAAEAERENERKEAREFLKEAHIDYVVFCEVTKYKASRIRLANSIKKHEKATMRKLKNYREFCDDKRAWAE